MRKLSAAELKQVKDDLEHGRPISVAIEDFDHVEFAQQQSDAESKKGAKDDDGETPDKVAR
jgi:hypothetical protein